MKSKKQKKQSLLTLEGIVSQIKFRSPDNWAVFIVDSTLTNEIKKTTCTGTLSEIIDTNSEVKCTGIWERSDSWGLQFKCETVIPAEVKPDSDKAVYRLLCSLPGIGDMLARKALAEYGYEQAWKIAQTFPSVLGIYQLKTAERAKEKAIRLASSTDFKTTSYLLSIGLTDHQIRKIINYYGANKALITVQKNPYTLIEDIDGFAFLTVDKIAFKAGIKVNNTARIYACIEYVLNDSQCNEGNIWIHGKQLIKIVRGVLEDSAMKNEQPLKDLPDYQAVKKCIMALQETNKIVIDGAKVYSRSLLTAEKIIATKINKENK